MPVVPVSDITQFRVLRSSGQAQIGTIHEITTLKDAINRSSTRLDYDLALPECAHYCPFLPRVIGHHQNDPFPMASKVVEVDARSEASDQVLARHYEHSEADMAPGDPAQGSEWEEDSLTPRFYDQEAEGTGFDGHGVVERQVGLVGRDESYPGGYDKVAYGCQLVVVGGEGVLLDVGEQWGPGEAAADVHVCRIHGRLHKRVILGNMSKGTTKRI